MSVAEVLGNVTSHEIEELIQRHQVAFETYPIWDCPESGPCTALGWELVLIGMESETQTSDSREALVAVAGSILASHRNGAFDVAIHFSPRRPVSGHAAIALDLVYRNSADAHADTMATRALLELKARLHELGARGTWW